MTSSKRPDESFPRPWNVGGAKFGLHPAMLGETGHLALKVPGRTLGLCQSEASRNVRMIRLSPSMLSMGRRMTKRTVVMRETVVKTMEINGGANSVTPVEALSMSPPAQRVRLDSNQFSWRHAWYWKSRSVNVQIEQRTQINYAASHINTPHGQGTWRARLGPLMKRLWRRTSTPQLAPVPTSLPNRSARDREICRVTRPGEAWPLRLRPKFSMRTPTPT
mmetsp:Transcript_1682/g.4238  ORF Transcript_1682/g.4238 Transcript_1682/m.4238 type:complete len:220 (-) Transcript_1682:285-944(-)